MNLHWTNLTALQRNALITLCNGGPRRLSSELGEQLCNLGLAERVATDNFCISALGTTVPPQAFSGDSASGRNVVG